MPAKHSRPGFIATADGVELFYRDWHPQGTPGNGRTIVFVPSYSLPGDMWAYQMLSLARQGFRCVTYDRRGHGRSSDPGGGYDYDTLADDLAALIDALDLSDVTLVGYSMGGAEAVRYLTRHGSTRVARLALIASTLPMLAKTPDNPDGIDRDYNDAFLHDLTTDYPQWLADNARPFAGPGASQAMIDWIREMALRTSHQALFACNETVNRGDFRNELRDIDVPTLIVQGDRDESNPLELTSQRTARLIPNARLVVYEGAPHGIFLSDAARLTADIGAFASA
ncbi:MULTISPECIES: alpha/beta hydrolase [Caballeronia]|jgi:non-heme chloroperoxidase|uniref:Arylesterase n=1 Tax=Caballeronia zhejiangensis TaxID=871203 RepID=A0A656QKX7_9BURK|nr:MULTISPECIES: alpha/beta hydrolase [Caballeronia]EKS66710.1 alpha/beta hydrolase fold protein [Burkholderia sp. SJ98]KDR30972.1 arylesterase [Caballeronia zhejiangensis]MDR5790011.1 alpha/beta hydrolase [Caballeronia sp. LP003]